MMLSNLEVGNGAGSATPPPHLYFRRTVREVLSSVACFGARVTLPRPKNQAARMGLRFEKKVVEALCQRYSTSFATGVPFSFMEVSRAGSYSRPSTAIPDGLLLGPDGRSLCIVEIKLRHTGDAWFQLNQFYLPIVRAAIRGAFHLRTLEICANYDPGIKFPGGTAILDSIDEVWTVPAQRHPVFLWDRRWK